MVNGIFFEFGDSHYAEVLFVLGATVILANRVDAAFEVVLARSQTYPPKLRPDLCNKGYATITAFEQLQATMVSNGPQ